MEQTFSNEISMYKNAVRHGLDRYHRKLDPTEHEISADVRHARLRVEIMINSLADLKYFNCKKMGL